jgi:hypothetical protein
MAINIYESQELIDNIKTIFTESDIKIFEFNYNLYKNFKGKEKELIIDFEEVRKYLGFTKKENAKRLLIGHFINNKDYKINKSTFTPIGVKVLGRPVEKIMINLNTFKLYSFMASTEQSKKIYDYYINMEKIIIIFMETQLENNKKELENKNNEIENKNNEIENMKNILKNINITYSEQKKNGNIYVMTTDKPYIYKIGRTNNVDKRKKSLQTAQVEEVKILYEYKTCDDVLLEYIIHNILKQYKMNKEHFECDINYIKLIIQKIGDIMHVFKCSKEKISENEITEKILKIFDIETSNKITNKSSSGSSNVITNNSLSSSSNETASNNDIYLKFVNECTESSETHISTTDLYACFCKFFKKYNESTKTPSNVILYKNMRRLNIIIDNLKIDGRNFYGAKFLKLKSVII